MASEIKVNKITGKGATGGADAPLQFSGNTLTATIADATIADATITDTTITNATISKINLSGTAPSSSVAGDMHFDTVAKTLKFYAIMFCTLYF